MGSFETFGKKGVMKLEYMHLTEDEKTILETIKKSDYSVLDHGVAVSVIVNVPAKDSQNIYNFIQKLSKENVLGASFGRYEPPPIGESTDRYIFTLNDYSTLSNKTTEELFNEHTSKDQAGALIERTKATSSLMQRLKSNKDGNSR